MVEWEKNMQGCVERVNIMQVPGGSENGDDDGKNTIGVKEGDKPLAI